MTADPSLAAVYQLEAERLRPSRDEKPSDPMRELIALLDRLLTNPGPPDPAPVLPPVPPDRPETPTTTPTKETTSHE